MKTEAQVWAEHETIEREMGAIEEQYRGQPFNAMPPATQSCWSELFERFQTVTETLIFEYE